MSDSTRKPNHRALARRAILTVASACVAGLALGGFAVHQYETMQRSPWSSLFVGMGLSDRQSAATDSLMTRYGCAIDSVYNSVGPSANALRQQLRREIEAQLTLPQAKEFRERLADADEKRRHRHDAHNTSCGRH